jgi:hypothetical protein
LKTVEQRPVEAVSPAVLLQPLQLQADRENRLVIDLPGEELPVLQALKATKLLHRFGQLYLHCGKDSLYKGSEKASHILYWLKNHGFEPLGVNHSLDPDRPCWTLQRNTLQLENYELQHQVKALQAELERAVEANNEQSKQVSDLNARIHRLTRERDANTKLIGERQALVEQLTKTRDDQAAMATEQQQQVAQLTKAKDEQAGLICELQAQVLQLTGERDEQAKLAADRDAQLRMAAHDKDELEKERCQHQCSAKLKKEVDAFLAGDSPVVEDCPDAKRLELLGALFTLAGDRNKSHKNVCLTNEALAFIREIDSLLMSGTDASTFVGQLSRSEFDPAYVTELLYCRAAELLALSFVAVGDYDSAWRVYSELLRPNMLLDLVCSGQSEAKAGWLLENYDKQLTSRLLREIADVSELATSFTAKGEIDPIARYFLCTVMGDFFLSEKDNLKACHFYSMALKYSNGEVHLIKRCVGTLTEMNQAYHALGVLLDSQLQQLDVADSKKTALLNLFENTISKMKPAMEHGHDALMKAVDGQLAGIRQAAGEKRLVLIEIGTTRELVGGQGSTEKLARFCRDRNIHFISVDMDPANIEGVRGFVEKINPEFELIAARGEDYLADYAGQIDFIFLDAYDFDHGKHSEARQVRYEKVLGERINDAACHKMHLDCAMSLVARMSPWGMLALDDVWFQDGSWHGKGTTAMPYLLANGFQVIHLANNAAVLVRSNPDA